MWLSAATTFTPGWGGTSNSRITIQAKVLSIDALRLSPAVEDSAELMRLFDVENAIAWKVAGVIDPHFSASEQTFLGAPGGVPLPAFEDYIRGINATTDAERLKRLKNAVSQVPNYTAALLELGKEQYAQRDFDGAAATLAKVPKNDRLALEANFYLGLADFNSANYAAAQTAFAFVASRLPLPEVVNNEGGGGEPAGQGQRGAVPEGVRRRIRPMRIIATTWRLRCSGAATRRERRGRRMRR